MFKAARFRLGSRLLALIAGLLIVVMASPPASAAPVGSPPGSVGTVTATPVVGGVTIRWSPPTDPGSSAITSYRITQSPGGSTVDTGWVLSTSYTVTGLTPGTTYSYTVAASNSVGSGPASAPSNGVAPLTPKLPQTPTAVSADPVNDGLQVAWTAAPEANPPVEQYRITVQPSGLTQIVSASKLSERVSGLSNGTAYTVTVAAQNAVGWGPESAPSAPVAPAPSGPSAPRDLVVAADQGALSVSWSEPADDGGAAVSEYVVRTDPGGATTTLAASARTVQLTGLDPAISYSVSVMGRNAIADGATATSEPVSPAVAVPSHTIVLTPQTQSSLLAIHTDGSLEFASLPGQLTAIAPGDVLVSGVSPQTPNGLLKKVTRVTTGSTTRIITTPASLDDALTDGDVSLDRDLSQAQVAAFVPHQKGVRMPSRLNRADGLTLDVLEIQVATKLYESGTSPASVDLEGVYRIRPTVSFDGSIGLTSSRIEMSMGFGYEEEIQLKAQKTWSADRRIPLASVVFQPITFFIGPVPVVLVPRMEVSADADGSISVGVMVSAVESGHVGFSLAVSDGRVSATPDNHRDGFSWKNPQIYGEATVKFGATVRGELLLYGIGGAFAELFLGLEAQVNTSDDPWWRVSALANLDVGLGLNSAISRFLDLKEFKTEDLVAFRDELVRADGPFMGVSVSPASADVPLGGTQTFTANIPTRLSDLVTWSVPAGCGSIKGGVYKAPTKLPAAGSQCIVTATSPANGFAPESTGTAEVVVGGDLPGPPENVTATPWQESAFVRWTAPRKTGGSPVSKYLITTSPPSYETEVVGDLTAKILGLTPGQRYRVFVTAVNATGPGLPSSPSDEILIPDVEPKPGSVQSWGSYGLGQSLELFSDLPAPLYDLSRIRQIAAGTYTGYAVDQDGSLWSWGGNGWGQLGVGNGDLAPVTHGLNVVSLGNVTDVAASDSTAFAATTDGRAWVWGSVGGYLQTSGPIAAATAPVAVPGLSDVVAIEPGMALRADGTVWAWGTNNTGQLGDGTTVKRLAPARVGTLSDIVAIAGNGFTQFAITSGGEVWGWGLNDNGQIGSGVVSSRDCTCLTAPVRVAMPVAVASMTGVGRTPVAVGVDGRAYSWGAGGVGQLGNGSILTRGCACDPVPKQIPGLQGVLQTAANGGNGYALTSDGAIYAWGYGVLGGLGTGSDQNSASPVRVQVLGPVAKIFAGASAAFAVRSDDGT